MCEFNTKLNFLKIHISASWQPILMWHSELKSYGCLDCDKKIDPDEGGSLRFFSNLGSTLCTELIDIANRI